MTVNEAYSLVVRKYPDRKAVKCYEYETVYVFQLVPVDFDMTRSTKNLMDSLTSVNKKTKQVLNFKPFNLPVEEYKRGREVKIPFHR